LKNAFGESPSKAFLEATQRILEALSEEDISYISQIDWSSATPESLAADEIWMDVNQKTRDALGISNADEISVAELGKIMVEVRAALTSLSPEATRCSDLSGDLVRYCISAVLPAWRKAPRLAAGRLTVYYTRYRS